MRDTVRARYYRIRRYLRHHGPRIHLRPRYCQLHNERVRITTRATRSKRGAVFCSRECKAERAHPTPALRAKILDLTRPKCPRPDKRKFDTEAECREAFHTLLVTDAELCVYQCRCGLWHAGHGGDVGRRLGSLIDPDVARELMASRGPQ